MKHGNHTGPDLRTYTLKLWIAAGVVIATVLILALLFYGLVIPLIFFAGLLLALILRIPTDWISRHCALPPRVTLVAILAALLAMAAIFIYFFSSNLQQQLQELAQILPSSLSQLRDKLIQLGI